MSRQSHEMRHGGWPVAARFRRWAGGLPPWIVDTAVCVLAAAATVYRIATAAWFPVNQAPDALAYGLGLAMAGALLGRRRWPALTLSVIVLLWLTYHVLGYPGGAPAVPVWIALYSGAVAPRRRVALSIAGALIVSDALARTARLDVGLLDTALDSSTVVFVAALLLGEVVRSRRAWQQEVEARSALLAAGRERAAIELVTEARMGVARELHDVSAHTLTVITVQADVAAELLTEEPEQARQALQEVRVASREAMGQLRAAVAVLREPGDSPGSATPPAWPARHGLDELAALAAVYGPVAPPIHLAYRGERRVLPEAVETAGYRIVQESLVNVLRHAAASRVDVVIEYRPDGLALEVRDDGAGPPFARGSAEGGHGLRGMTERATALGGWLSAGPVERGGEDTSGFQVRAWLPTAGRP